MAENSAKKSKAKQFGYFSIAIVAILCVGIIVWWSLVQAFAPNKVVYNTYNVGQIQTADGSDKKNVIEVRYYSNDKGNGLEMLDIKFNEYLDETKSMFYSQGIQFVANTPEDSLEEWTFSIKKSNVPLGGIFSKNTWWGSYDKLQNGTIHTYASADDFATTLNDAEELDSCPDFKIELQKVNGEGSDLYLMEMQGTNTKKEDAVKAATTGQYGVDVYAYNDIYCLSKKIYQKIQGLANGTTQNLVFDLGDMFEFKNYESGAYLDDEERDTAKVDSRVQAYYVIKVEVFEDGARQASDSMFNNVKGSASFILDGNYEDNDYYIGRSQLNLTNAYFDKKVLNANGVVLSLKQEFLDATKAYKASIELNITIDLDKLEDEGYTFLGFSSTSGLKNYTIRKCVTIKTIDGVRIETEVDV